MPKVSSADYILNHYSKNSVKDKIVLDRQLNRERLEFMKKGMRLAATMCDSPSDEAEKHILETASTLTLKDL
jgi:hypothetical protein